MTLNLSLILRHFFYTTRITLFLDTLPLLTPTVQNLTLIRTNTTYNHNYSHQTLITKWFQGSNVENDNEMTSSPINPQSQITGRFNEVPVIDRKKSKYV